MLFSSFSALSDPTGVPLGTSDPTCDNDTLGTYGPSAELEADWTPNPIELHWYNGNTEIDAQNTNESGCTYDDIVVPVTTPSRTGYTFGGWKVRPTYDFSQLMSVSGYRLERWSINYTSEEEKVCKYGVTGNTANVVSCNSSDFEDLQIREWKDRFSWGWLYGVSKCSVTSGTYATSGEPDDASGLNCWCKLTGFKPLDEDVIYSPSTSPVWVFDETRSGCLINCANKCGERFGGNVDYWRVAFR